jgi:hypothetical protein
MRGLRTFRFTFAQDAVNRSFWSEAMAVRTTKITIETEGLLVIRQARTVVALCPDCQDEVEAMLLDEGTAQLLSGLPAGTLHMWNLPEGPVFICLRSLMRRSQPNDVSTTSERSPQGDGR